MKKILIAIVALMALLTSFANAEFLPIVEARDNAEKAIAIAESMLGKPYVLGTRGTSSFDCSGLTLYCYEGMFSLPHSAKDQGYAGCKILKEDLQRGDLVFFNTVKDKDKCDHVGIYLGNNEFIHASSKKKKVVISKLSAYTSFSWGRRLV